MSTAIQPSPQPGVCLPPGPAVTVALVGGHCCGKTTLGKRLAERLGFDWDEELGEVALKDHSGACCWALQDDWDILRGEAARDSMARAGRRLGRVVETWHPGNHAWALNRDPPNDPEALDGLFSKAAAAVAEEAGERRVVALALTCGEETRLERRRAEGAKRLTPCDSMGENEFFEATRRIGDQAIAAAREMLGPDAVREVCTDCALDEAVARAVAALVEALRNIASKDKAVRDVVL